MDTNLISVAVTTYNRTDLLFEALLPFISDDRVSEIVISDDHSPEEIFQTIIWKYTGVDKVQIFRNNENLDCYYNKRQAVKKCKNDWILLIDSDNVFGTEFLDVLFSQAPFNNSWAYAPEFARPHFDFRQLAGTAISRNNVSSLLDVGNCSTMLNAMNYFVNRDEYLRVWSNKVDPVTSDSLYQNYNWLKGGNSIYVVKDLQYNHRVHDGSHYKNNVSRTPSGFHDDILNRLRNL